LKADPFVPRGDNKALGCSVKSGLFLFRLLSVGIIGEQGLILLLDGVGLPGFFIRDWNGTVALRG